MPFRYTSQPHARKHGPTGYTDYRTYKDWLRDEFDFRCVYCLCRERWYPSGAAAFGVEPVKPKGLPAYQHLECDYDNLVYACNRCNSLMRQKLLVDPCADALATHLRVNDDGTLVGLSAPGRDLVDALYLDEPDVIATRRQYLRTRNVYRQRPEDEEARQLFLHAFGFPQDLPKLNAKKRCGNTRRSGLAQVYHRQRTEGRLALVYSV